MLLMPVLDPYPSWIYVYVYVCAYMNSIYHLENGYWICKTS